MSSLAASLSQPSAEYLFDLEHSRLGGATRATRGRSETESGGGEMSNTVRPRKTKEIADIKPNPIGGYRVCNTARHQ